MTERTDGIDPDDEQARTAGESGLDKGTGDPNDDRAFLMDQGPAEAEPDDEGADDAGE